MAVLGLENGDSLLLWDGRSLALEASPELVSGSYHQPATRQGLWATNKPLPGCQLNRNEPITTGLVGYWPFNEGAGRAQDLASQHHGIFSGGAGWSNRAASFNGSTAVVTCAGAQRRLRNYPLSVTVWFRAASAHSGTLVQYTSTSFSQALKLSTTSGGALEWSVAGGFSTATVSAGAYTANRWHCVTAVCRSDARHELYVDGQLVGSSTTSVVYPTLDQCTFGYAYDWMMGWSSPFSGLIAGVAVHARALSVNEIRLLVQQPYRFFRPPPGLFLPATLVDAAPTSVVRVRPLAGARPLPGSLLDYQNPLARGLTSYWPLNETTGATVLDQVRNKTSSLSGASWRGGRLYLGGSPALVSVAGAEKGVRAFPISMSAWFKADSLHYGTILCLSNTSIRGYCYLGCDIAGVLYWSLGDTTTDNALPGGNYQPGSWVHVVGVSRGAADHLLYVNGQLVLSHTGALATFPSLNTATLGAAVDSGGAAQYFRGQLGPCAIYNRALNSTEIAQLALDQFALLTSRARYLPFAVDLTQTIILSSAGTFSSVAAPGLTTEVGVSVKSTPLDGLSGEVAFLAGNVTVSPITTEAGTRQGYCLLTTSYSATLAGIDSESFVSNHLLSAGGVSVLPKTTITTEIPGQLTTTTSYTVELCGIESVVVVGGTVCSTLVSVAVDAVSAVDVVNLPLTSSEFTVVTTGLENSEISTVELLPGSVGLEVSGIQPDSVIGVVATTALGTVVQPVSLPGVTVSGLHSVIAGSVSLLPPATATSNAEGVTTVLPAGVLLSAHSISVGELVGRVSLTTENNQLVVSITAGSISGNAATTPGNVLLQANSSSYTESVSRLQLFAGVQTISPRSNLLVEQVGGPSAFPLVVTLSQQSVERLQNSGLPVVSSNRSLLLSGVVSGSEVSTSSISRVILSRSIISDGYCSDVVVTRYNRTITVRSISPSEAVGLVVIPRDGESAEGAGFHLEVFINPVDTLF